jgi:hypothetical protein
MPAKPRKQAQYRPQKDVEVVWQNFEGGWNSIFRPTELKDNELAQADNLMLVGKGVPTGRWGTEVFNQAGSAGRIRLLDAYYNSGASQNFLLSITDGGYLNRKSGASYAVIPGASFPSGSDFQSIQMGNFLYISGASTPLVRFDGANLVSYERLSAPTNVSLAKLSAASGFTEYSWLVTAVSRTGETEYSPVYTKSMASLPLDLTQTAVRVSWNAVSSASGTLVGYNVYRGLAGDETYIASTSPTQTEFIDYGDRQSDTQYPPNTNTTDGIRAKYIIKFEDRLVVAGIPGDQSRVYISGRYPYHDRFSAFDGGGYVSVSPDDGDDITGLGVAANQETGLKDSSILVFKGNSVHRVTLSFAQLGNFLVLNPISQLLTSSNGCSAANTIITVENDTFYFGRRGLFSIGQEPAFLNQLRTNEISARIRPYIQSLTKQDFTEATAGYMDNKYILAFPTRREAIIYDRERGCFMGPWKTPWGITALLRYFDTDGSERWIAGTTPYNGNGPKNRLMSPSLTSDSGEPVRKLLRTKKEDMGSWSVMKVLKLFYVLFRNVRGLVDVNLLIEERSGKTVVSKNIRITSSLGNGGWGSDMWGTQVWGETDATVVLTGDELARYAQIYKNVRVLQVEVLSNGSNDDWEFLGLRITGQPLGDSSLSSRLKV